MKREEILRELSEDWFLDLQALAESGVYEGLGLDLEPDKEKLWEEAYRRAGDDEELAERIFDEIHFDEIGRLYEEAEERVRWLFGELGIHPVYLDLGDWDVHLEIRLSDEDRERLRSILETSK